MSKADRCIREFHHDLFLVAVETGIDIHIPLGTSSRGHTDITLLVIFHFPVVRHCCGSRAPEATTDESPTPSIRMKVPMSSLDTESLVQDVNVYGF